jgi:very-short-patch-repair endonuclease
VRARRGWYVLPDAPPGVVDAVRVGGRATCTTALATYGVWVPLTSHPHVALKPNASRLRSPTDRTLPLEPASAREATLHWQPWNAAHRENWRVGITDAIVHAAWCVEGDEFVAIVDSAVGSGVLSASSIWRVRERSPVRLRRAFASVDSRSGSGTETLVRLALRRARLRVRTQVEIDRVGRVDLLVGNRVIVEVDSRAWHEDAPARRRDYARDLALANAGFIVIRVSWHQAMFERDAIVAGVIRAASLVRP